MHYNTLEPPHELAHVVRAMWVLGGTFSEEGYIPYRLFADGSPNLVFHYQNHFTDLGISPRATSPSIGVLAAQTDTYKDLKSKGKFGMIGFYLFPHAVKLLFAVPSNEITNSTIDIAELLGPRGRQLEEEVMLATSNEDRLRIVCRFLIERLRRSNITRPGVQTCVSEIIARKGLVSIDQLAQTVNLSNRQLDRNFNQSVGLTPKLFSRIVRFRSALKLLGQGKEQSLTRLGYELGYSDQSHFIRDFKTFAGITPKIYHRELEETADSFVRIA